MTEENQFAALNTAYNDVAHSNKQYHQHSATQVTMTEQEQDAALDVVNRQDHNLDKEQFSTVIVAHTFRIPRSGGTIPQFVLGQNTSHW